MCGILYCKLKSDQVDRHIFRTVFENALEQMHYRGPDAMAVAVSGDHFFGHVRLSIIDLKPSSDQPYQDESHVMIYNGEIYNYKEIDPESDSDTKTLFNCLNFSSNPFEKLRGMFAIGWHDKKTEETYFYRDFFGEKPLYYYVDKDIEIVSSTLKSINYLIKSQGGQLTLNIESIKRDFLLFGYIREPKTIWKEVFAVPPAHQLKFNNDKTEITPLNFDIRNSALTWTESPYIKQALLSTDVEGTLLLSGGVDSTLILSEAVKSKTHLRLGIYKSINPEIDESVQALRNIGKIGLNTDEFPVSILHHSKNNVFDIDGYAKILEQPSSDGMQLFYLLKYLREKYPSLKLVYTGLGGDEIFGGYPTFYNYNKINLLIHIPFSEYIFPSISRFKFGKLKLKNWNKEIYSFLYRFNFVNFNLLKGSDDDLIAAFNNHRESIQAVPQEILIYSRQNNKNTIKRAETFDYARNQLLRDNDNISMYLGFESRSPLLNPDWFFQKTDKKQKFKKTLRQRFGIQFKKKRGFTLDESNAKDTIVNYIHLHEDILKTFFPLLSLQALSNLSASKLRAFAILIGWLKYNAL